MPAMCRGIVLMPCDDVIIIVSKVHRSHGTWSLVRDSKKWTNTSNTRYQVLRQEWHRVPGLKGGSRTLEARWECQRRMKFPSRNAC